MARRTDIRILVVDDTAVSRQLLRQMLERFGVRSVSTAATAEEALDQMRRQHADMVISDLHMPGMDGVELLERLRLGQRTRDVGFILTTGLDCSPRLDAARRLRLDALLIKPFVNDRLLDAVETVSGRL